jgi:membrane-associated phospholipid phosphatase
VACRPAATLKSLLAGLVEIVQAWDRAASSFGESIRFQPLTFVLLLASTWWVKWPLIAAIGWAGDCSRRRIAPRAAAAALAAVGVSALLVTVLKTLFDRARPPLANPTLDVVGSLPASASFPSGHAATAFAAAVAVGMIHPRLRRPLLALAFLVAVSRVYLGVHYATDVIAGSAIGALLGLAAGWAVRAAAPAPTAPSPSRAPA